MQSSTSAISSTTAYPTKDASLRHDPAYVQDPALPHRDAALVHDPALAQQQPAVEYQKRGHNVGTFLGGVPAAPSNSIIQKDAAGQPVVHPTVKVDRNGELHPVDNKGMKTDKHHGLHHDKHHGVHDAGVASGAGHKPGLGAKLKGKMAEKKEKRARKKQAKAAGASSPSSSDSESDNEARRAKGLPITDNSSLASASSGSTTALSSGTASSYAPAYSSGASSLPYSSSSSSSLPYSSSSSSSLPYSSSSSSSLPYSSSSSSSYSAPASSALTSHSGPTMMDKASAAVGQAQQKWQTTKHDALPSHVGAGASDVPLTKERGHIDNTSAAKRETV